MTDLTLEQRARELLADAYQAAGWENEAQFIRAWRGRGNEIALSAIAAALQAQQPGAQAVAWMEPHEGGVIDAVTKAGEPWASVYTVPLYLHPQPPSIPEPSDEDVWSGCAAFDASPASAGCGIYGSDAILDVLTTYTARLRERIGGGL